MAPVSGLHPTTVSKTSYIPQSSDRDRERRNAQETHRGGTGEGMPIHRESEDGARSGASWPLIARMLKSNQICHRTLLVYESIIEQASSRMLE